MPRVSVITALFNHKPFLRERVRSILSQTLNDFEWIIVDDSSTDGSFEEICQLTANDRRVTILRNSSNRGFTLTTQRALELAQGEYLYRADSDDSCAPSFLEVMASLLATSPDVGFAYCRGLRMDIRNGVWGGFPRYPARHIIAPEAFREQVMNYTIRSPTILFRRQHIDRAGGFALLPLKVSSDWHLALRVALIGDVIFHPAPLAYHRTHASNISGGLLPKPAELELENFTLLTDVFDRLPERHASLIELRPAAYANAARRMAPVLARYHRQGLLQEYENALAMIRKYVPDYDLSSFRESPNAQIKYIVERLVGFAIKRLTYKTV